MPSWVPAKGYTQRDRAASETGFCFDSLTEKSWGEKIFKLRACGVGGSGRIWSSGGVAKFAKAPPLQLGPREQSVSVCVCARARLCVCVCDRACVCVERGGSQPSLGSSTPRLQVGQWGGGVSHLRALSFPWRGPANSGQAPATSNPGRLAARASPRKGDPGL